MRFYREQFGLVHEIDKNKIIVKKLVVMKQSEMRIVYECYTHKKAMQALTLYGNTDYVYYLLFDEITRDKYKVMCENEK